MRRKRGRVEVAQRRAFARGAHLLDEHVKHSLAVRARSKATCHREGGGDVAAYQAMQHAVPFTASL
eukprot:358421-Chlamydomonas_euryale.AAC.2